MRTMRVISVIGLAAFLVLQGLYQILALQAPIVLAVIGLIGLVAGVFMLISIKDWIDFKRD